ncbi:hypothetical protein SAMN05880592_1232 [Bosea sp. TND4EK4]|nr:hypothetical protein SAMN05880592_1232 [Bosea sp. TND4EK4]
MFSTRSLTAKLVKTLDVPACLSTIGPSEACYVAANDGYLKMVERIWAELENRNLVTSGSAISSPQRDRRLWLLETRGFYDTETAEIRTAMGRALTVKISSQRVWCSGTACDLEFFTPAPSLQADPPPVAVRDATQKAAFSARVRKNLEVMRPLERDILIRRMLSLTAEGLALAARLSEAAEAAEVMTTLETITQRLHPFRAAARKRPNGFDFDGLNPEAAQELLLQLAGEIWLVIVFCDDRQISDLLRTLVEGYTVPKPVLLNRVIRA